MLILVSLVLQIILESFPVSSSGHLVLVQKSMQADALSIAYDSLFMLPNILIILVFFFSSWFPLVRRLFCYNKINWYSYRQLWRLFFRVIGYTIISVSVTVGWYILFHVVGTYTVWLARDSMLLIGFTLTALLLFSLRFVHQYAVYRNTMHHDTVHLDVARRNALHHNALHHNTQYNNIHYRDTPYRNTKYRTLTPRIAFLLGCAQGIALLPGISRLASTYVAGRWLQLSPRRSFQISFLIALPVMIAGVVKDICMIDTKTVQQMLALFGSWYQVSMLVAIVIPASIVSFFLLHVTYTLACKNKLWLVGWYLFFPIILLLKRIFFT